MKDTGIFGQGSLHDGSCLKIFLDTHREDQHITQVCFQSKVTEFQATLTKSGISVKGLKNVWDVTRSDADDETLARKF